MSIQISFEEFSLLCYKFRVEHVNSRLRADYDKKLNDLIGYFEINIGSNNDKESFDIDQNTFNQIIVNEDILTIKGIRPDGKEENFIYRNWDF
jgi:hypothetical protein